MNGFKGTHPFALLWNYSTAKCYWTFWLLPVMMPRAMLGQDDVAADAGSGCDVRKLTYIK